MVIAGEYSFNNGLEQIRNKYPFLLDEIYEIIQAVDAQQHKTKKSKEKTMLGKMLFSPPSLNKNIKREFVSRSWKVSRKITCDYPTQFYTKEFQPLTPKKGRGTPYREMDFIKEQLGVEVQFGKYAFMVYNVCAKMTIFSNLGIIDMGVEIVPLKQFVYDMSSGVSYFEQFVWDLENRGVSDIDIPVLILGIDA